MKFRIGLAAVAFAVAATGFAAANEDIIALRQQAMKGNGAAAKVAVGMLRGEIPFDAAVAEGAALSIAGAMDGFVLLFPEGTEEGNTKAGAAIWSDPDGFAAAAMATKEAATAAAAAAAEGQEAFGAAFQQVGASCGACHETYREG